MANDVCCIMENEMCVHRYTLKNSVGYDHHYAG